MLKTITYLIGQGRSMLYSTGIIVLLISLIFPLKTFSQDCTGEVIPITAIQFPEGTSISCNDWDGEIPSPDITGFPFFVNGDEEKVFLEPDSDEYCVTVSFSDEQKASGDCEIKKYKRTWTVEVESEEITDVQIITVVDEDPPTGEFHGTPIGFETFEINGESLSIPVYPISTGVHNCTSDGLLPRIYATDNCVGVHTVNVSAEVDGEIFPLTNGGPFMGFDEGTYVIHYELSDSCWNMSDYYAAVRVADHKNPVVALSSEYNLTLSNTPVSWLRLSDFAEHHISDNCGLEFIVGRRIGDHATACGSGDPDSDVEVYRDGFTNWVENHYSGNCADLIHPEEGWMDKIPFCCADVGQAIEIEILVIDEACNVTRGRTIIHPLDLGVVSINEELPDVTLACEAWSEFYADKIFSDSAPTVPDPDSLDKYFGTYLMYFAGSENQNHPVTIQDYTFGQVGGVWTALESDFNISNGSFYSICESSLTQEVEQISDGGCNSFTIVRRFLVNGFEMGSQRITTEIRRPYDLSLFDFPAKKDTSFTVSGEEVLSDPANWQGKRFNLTTNGPQYNGEEGCRIVAVGYSDVRSDYVSGPLPRADALIIRTWSMTDWCSEEVLTWIQKIKIFYDADQPDTPIERPGSEGGIVHPSPVSEKVFDISGRIRTEDALNVENVVVELDAGETQEAQMTNESGSYNLRVKEGDRVRIVPDKKDVIGNGLSTMDLIMIQRHLLGKQLLASPYKLLAADANNDKKLTPADILFLRKIILGQTEDLEMEASWKFVDANYAFVNQREAYAENYPTLKDIRYVDRDVTGDFIAVKLGDVDHSVNVTRSSGRSLQEKKFLSLEDRMLEPGEVVAIPIHWTEDLELRGIQLALRYPTESVEILDVHSGKVSLRKEEFSLRPGEVRVSWFDVDGIDMKTGTTFVTLEIRARDRISLRDVLGLATAEVEPEMYSVSDQTYSVGLTFDKASEVFEVLQNRPNPARGETLIGYVMDRMSDVKLTIHDLNGRLLYGEEAVGVQGVNDFRVRTDRLGSGIMYYTVSDGIQSITRKMVVVK